MIAKHPIGPATDRQQRFVLAHDAIDGQTLPRCADQLEVERQLHALQDSVLARTVIGHQPGQRKVDLANEYALRIGTTKFIGNASHLDDDVLHFGTIGRVERSHRVGRLLGGPRDRIERVVAEQIVLDQMIDHVDAKTVDAAFEPEAHHVVHRGAYVGVAPAACDTAREASGPRRHRLRA